jgi:hypothetical protein
MKHWPAIINTINGIGRNFSGKRKLISTGELNAAKELGITEKVWMEKTGSPLYFLNLPPFFWKDNIY